VKSVTPIVLILVIIGCGVFLFLRSANKPAKGATVPHLQPLACMACGKIFQKMEGDLPAKCPFCGELAVYRAQECAKCGDIVPWPEGVGGNAPKGPSCTCGEKRFRDPSDPSKLPKVEG